MAQGIGKQNPYIRRRLVDFETPLRHPGILHKTASFSVNKYDSDRVFTNKGAAGAVTVTLPTNAHSGMEVTFITHAAQNFIVTPDAAANIYAVVGGTYAAQGAGTAITGNAAGDNTKLRSDGTDWWEIFQQGSWT